MVLLLCKAILDLVVSEYDVIVLCIPTIWIFLMVWLAPGIRNRAVILSAKR